MQQEVIISSTPTSNQSLKLHRTKIMPFEGTGQRTESYLRQNREKKNLPKRSSTYWSYKVR